MRPLRPAVDSSHRGEQNEPKNAGEVRRGACRAARKGSSGRRSGWTVDRGGEGRGGGGAEGRAGGGGYMPPVRQRYLLGGSAAWFGTASSTAQRAAATGHIAAGCNKQWQAIIGRLYALARTKAEEGVRGRRQPQKHVAGGSAVPPFRQGTWGRGTWHWSIYASSAPAQVPFRWAGAGAVTSPGWGSSCPVLCLSRPPHSFSLSLLVPFTSHPRNSFLPLLHVVTGRVALLCPASSPSPAPQRRLCCRVAEILHARSTSACPASRSDLQPRVSRCSADDDDEAYLEKTHTHNTHARTRRDARIPAAHEEAG